MSAETLRLPDPDGQLARLVELHAAALTWQRCSRLEIYHRAAVTLRVLAGEDGQPTTTRVGNDEGLAVRIRRPGERGVFFAAASGGDESKLRWAFDRALHGRAVESADEGWPGDRDSAMIDHDPESRLPSPLEMQAWMSQALEPVTAHRRRASAPEVLQAWVEVALTVESWVSETGMRCSRRRIRAWAMLKFRPKGGAARVLPVAGRSWGGLPTSEWGRLVQERGIPRRRTRLKSPGKQTLLFNSDTSATLVSSLTRAVHLGPPEKEIAVGPGWEIGDEPQDPTALSGGLFDDAGYYTASTPLAARGAIVGSLEGEGFLRRSSFRDPPAPQASHLVVRSRSQSMPEEGLLVSDLRIHPLRPGRWVLEIEAHPLPEGSKAGLTYVGYVRTSPKELLWRCAACLAPGRFSHRGVHTGSLLFEDLPVS